MSLLKCFLKNIDIFGQPIKLMINGNEDVRSLLGGFMTICLLVLVGVTFVIYSTDCFLKLNPQVNASTQYLDKELIFLNQTYFTFKIGSNSQLDATRLLNFDIGNYTLSDCDKFDEKTKIITSPSYNGTILTNNYYCIDFINSTEFMSNFRLKLSYCSKNEKCLSKNEINNLIIDNFISFDYSFDSMIVDLFNYSDPLTIQRIEYSSFFFPNYNNVNTLGFSISKLFTDNGFIYSNKYSDSNESLIITGDDYQMETLYPDLCLKSNHTSDCDGLFEINLRSYRNLITYQRTYKRISDALANTGGILSVVMQVLLTIMYFYCNFIRNESIANHIYDFEKDEHHKTNEIGNFIREKIQNNHKNGDGYVHKENSNILELNIELGGRGIYFKNDEVKTNIHSGQKDQSLQLFPIDKINQKKSQKNYKFKFLHLVAYYLGCHYKKNSDLKKRYNEFEKVNQAIYSLLDIKRILYQLEDHDNLKMVLLDNEQFALLNYITKYNFSETIDVNNHIYNNEKYFLKNEDNLRNLVNEVLVKFGEFNTIINPITLKLIQYLNKNFLDNNCK